MGGCSSSGKEQIWDIVENDIKIIQEKKDINLSIYIFVNINLWEYRNLWQVWGEISSPANIDPKAKNDNSICLGNIYIYIYNIKTLYLSILINSLSNMTAT